MRSTGSIEAVRGFGLHDHLCWSYDDPRELRTRTAEFLGAGLEQGLRVCYVSDGSVDSLRLDLQGVPNLDRELDRGTIRIVPIDGVYPTGSIVDASAQVEVYREYTEEALADGYAGFRLVAEATPMVRSKEQLRAFVGYEFLVDGLMARRPFSAMCAYNTTVLDAESIAALAAVHPNARASATQFHLYNLEGVDLALSGEIDAGVQARFDQALECAHVTAMSEPLTIDGTELAFLDHRTLFALAKCASRTGTSALFRTRSTMPARLVEMLQIEGIRIEQIS
jgi:anti-anti-sigma regulatory factor